MLYKVTPMMPPPEEEKGARKTQQPAQPKKKRKSAVYDADGNEVLISLMCAKCKSLKPLASFGLRKMADGAIRNQPWCRTCRGATGGKKLRAETIELPAVASGTPSRTAATQEIPAVGAPGSTFRTRGETIELPAVAEPSASESRNPQDDAMEVTVPGRTPARSE